MTAIKDFYEDYKRKKSDNEENKGKVLAATNLGREVFNHLNSKFSFMNYDYTATMEDSLDKIESGSLTYVDFLNNFYKDFSTELINLMNKVKQC